jgi:hypothetical protein
MKTYWFWVIREHGGPIEKLRVDAADSGAAVELIPRCVSWNFCINR